MQKNLNSKKKEEIQGRIKKKNFIYGVANVKKAPSFRYFSRNYHYPPLTKSRLEFTKKKYSKILNLFKNQEKLPNI